MNLIESFDNFFLFLFNGHHSEFMDRVMWSVSDRWIWIPFYALLIAYMIYRLGWRKSVVFLICIAAVITLTDQLCGSVIRPLVERMRPSNPSNPISSMITVVNDYHGGRYGFPSCHAANAMALATFLALVFRTRSMAWLMLCWAVTVSVSRLYLGVHYPTDLLAGWAVGTLIAWGVYRIYLVCSRMRRPRIFEIIGFKG